MMEFAEFYNGLKREGKSDREIAEIMCVARSTIYRRKKKYGIYVEPKSSMLIGEFNLTKEQIKGAMERGINYDTLWQRLINYGWTVEMALYSPIVERKNRRHVGVTITKREGWE
jgi:hypothetical protein